MPAATERPIADDELLITRHFNAPLALVWRLWEDPTMRRWWGPGSSASRQLESDFRPGGKWRIHVVETYGDSWSSGEWREIERPGRITFTFAWEEGTGETTQTLVTVLLEERDSRTTFAALPPDPVHLGRKPRQPYRGLELAVQQGAALRRGSRPRRDPPAL